MKYVRTITVVLFVLTLAAYIISSVMFNRNDDAVKPIIESTADTIQVSVKDGPEALLQGLTASDDKDGNLTDRIIVGKQTRFVKEGICDVTYLVFDSGNNVGEYTRQVEYTDYESPKFKITKPLEYKLGEEVKILDRLKVIDSIEGDISDKIKIVSSNVDNTQLGAYEVGVEASNSFGDTITKKLTVKIVSTIKED